MPHNPRQPLPDDPDQIRQGRNEKVLYAQQDCFMLVRFPNVFQGKKDIKKGEQVTALRSNPKAFFCRSGKSFGWIERQFLAPIPPVADPPAEPPAE